VGGQVERGLGQPASSASMTMRTGPTVRNAIRVAVLFRECSRTRGTIDRSPSSEPADHLAPSGRVQPVWRDDRRGGRCCVGARLSICVDKAEIALGLGSADRPSTAGVSHDPRLLLGTIRCHPEAHRLAGRNHRDSVDWCQGSGNRRPHLSDWPGTCVPHEHGGLWLTRFGGHLILAEGRRKESRDGASVEVSRAVSP
jgi:hypothetical protein